MLFVILRQMCQAKPNMLNLLVHFVSILSFGFVCCEVCRSGHLRVNPDLNNMRLNGSVMITFSHFGPNKCFDECIRRPRCHSFNYNTQSYFCELNSEPQNVIHSPQDGVDFVDISSHRGVSTLIYIQLNKNKA